MYETVGGSSTADSWRSLSSENGGGDYTDSGLQEEGYSTGTLESTTRRQPTKWETEIFTEDATPPSSVNEEAKQKPSGGPTTTTETTGASIC